MSFTSTLGNIAEGVTSFFSGKTAASYPWYPHFKSFLDSPDTVLSKQINWCANPGYGFVVIRENEPNKTYAFKGTGDEAKEVSFSELKLNINPQSITVKEPFAIDIIPADEDAVGAGGGEQHLPRVIIGEFLAEGDDVFLAGITVNQNVLRHDGDNGVGAGSRPIGINDADVIVAGLADMKI